MVKATKTTKPRLQEQYSKEIVPALMKELGCTNLMQVPRLVKITLNMGVGEATQDSKKVQKAIEEMTLIAGQRPVPTKSRKAVSTFKLREGQTIGCKVTLRRDRMYEFLDRLINIALPRVRDFRGVNPKGFDGQGNYNMGIKEQLIFPEIDYDKVDDVRGMDITIVTTANTDDEGRALLRYFNMPFRK